MLKIFRIKAFKDNYIWLLVNPHNQTAVVFDPGQAEPVLDLLAKENLRLVGILITHHHWDHTGGVLKLVEQTHAPVYGGSREPITGLTNPLKEGDSLHFEELELSLQILDIPGHTLGHIAYYNKDWVFTGDTLFTAGCGRLFEGTAEQMMSSLAKIKNLPPCTEIYCGHEYTLHNLHFARLLEPKNLAVEKRIVEVENLLAKGLASVPAPLSLELETNPFLRIEEENIKKSVEQHYGTTFSSNIQIFIAIRKWKDQF